MNRWPCYFLPFATERTLTHISPCPWRQRWLLGTSAELTHAAPPPLQPHSKASLLLNLQPLPVDRRNFFTQLSTRNCFSWQRFLVYLCIFYIIYIFVLKLLQEWWQQGMMPQENENHFSFPVTFMLIERRRYRPDWLRSRHRPLLPYDNNSRGPTEPWLAAPASIFSPACLQRSSNSVGW